MYINNYKNKEMEVDKLRVNAIPAKSFFVTMLIKDITLRDAIGDLVDNAVDAIKASAPNKNDLSAYKVVVNLKENEFSILDNGQGMSTDVARSTAFNFGKAATHKLIDNSIGQFGIGMKRAFFKIGSNISVHSVTKDSMFDIDINVPAWLSVNEWEFAFNKDTLQEKIPQSEKSGFSVRITELSDDAKVSFADMRFINQLQNEIGYEHMLNIGKGLTIEINGLKLRKTSVALVYNDLIKPTYWEKISEDLSVKIMAGISVKSEDEGGWYVFCNDRLILAKDKTANTVWTGSKGDGVPLWHAQYHRFRGFVFFEAKDSSKLPWNTTKTGMDMDSPVYKKVRSQMILMTKQVMALMDKLKNEKEKDNPVDEQKLNIAIEQAVRENRVSVLELRAKSNELQEKFVYPEELYSPAGKGNQINIQYFVPKEKYQQVRSQLQVKSGRDVGRATFDYYCDNEL